MQKITIRSKDMEETKEVEAEIIGHLAVHAAWLSFESRDSHLYTITHVPTGANLPVLSEARRAVVACAKELSELVDWDFSDRDDAKGLNGIVVPVIEEWGVSNEISFH